MVGDAPHRVTGDEDRRLRQAEGFDEDAVEHGEPHEDRSARVREPRADGPLPLPLGLGVVGAAPLPLGDMLADAER